MTDHAPLDSRLDHIVEKLDAIERQTTATNGRTARLENQMLRVRGAVWGREDVGLESDGGLVGYVRQTRRDIRLLAATVIFLMPLVTVLIQRIS